MNNTLKFEEIQPETLLSFDTELSLCDVDLLFPSQSLEQEGMTASPNKRIKIEKESPQVLDLTSTSPNQLFVDTPDNPALFSDDSNQGFEDIFASLSPENPIENETCFAHNELPISENQQQTTQALPPKPEKMKSFPIEKVADFKHVVYNLLVEGYNKNGHNTLARPIVDEYGRKGFQFTQNQYLNPEKFLPELYAFHIRKCRLDKEDYNSIAIQDLYKFYLRACVELLAKYFVKIDKYTFLYDDVPLFVENETLFEAEQRIKKMKTRARNMKRKRI